MAGTNETPRTLERWVYKLTVKPRRLMMVPRVVKSLPCGCLRKNGLHLEAKLAVEQNNLSFYCATGRLGGQWPDHGRVLLFQREPHRKL